MCNRAKIDVEFPRDPIPTLCSVPPGTFCRDKHGTLYLRLEETAANLSNCGETCCLCTPMGPIEVEVLPAGTKIYFTVCGEKL